MLSLSINKLSNPEVCVSDIDVIAGAELTPGSWEFIFNPDPCLFVVETLPLGSDVHGGSLGVVLGENSGSSFSSFLP